MLHFLTSAANSTGSLFSPLLLMVVMFAVMYFMMIRPENKRKKKAQEMRDGLKKGDTVTTIGGIVGKIVHVNKDTIVIETSDDRVRMELTKWAVSSVGVQTGEQPEQPKKDEKKEEAPAEAPAEITETAETAETAEAEEK